MARENPKSRPRITKIGLLAGSAVGILLIASGAYAYWSGSITGTDRSELIRAEKLVTDRALDPQSVDFRNTRINLVMDGPAKGTKVVCGEYNGKNTQGAYAGFSRFLVTRADDQPVMRPVELHSQEETDNAVKACKAAAAEAQINRYSAITGKFECEQAVDMAKNRTELAKFDYLWDKICTKDKIYINLK